MGFVDFAERQLTSVLRGLYIDPVPVGDGIAGAILELEVEPRRQA